MEEPTEAQVPIPLTVVRRLPKYLMLVQNLRRQGEQWASSQGMADSLGLTSSTVRQDLSHLDCCGISKRGYPLGDLERSLSTVLGADSEMRLVIVGAGNLGRALALHGEFAEKGFRISAIVDADPRVVGTQVGDLSVQDVRALPALVSLHSIAIGVVAVPSRSAQEVADRLIISGVKGILNFAHGHLLVPRHVAVVDVRIISGLQELSYAIRLQNAAKPRLTAP